MHKAETNKKGWKQQKHQEVFQTKKRKVHDCACMQNARSKAHHRGEK